MRTKLFTVLLLLTYFGGWSQTALPPLEARLNQLPVVNVSSCGIANGLSTITNNGAPFGPDTPGTTTCGINEALASLPKSVSSLSAGGGTIQLDAGQYIGTRAITPPTNYPASYRFIGSGLLGTMYVLGGNSETNAVHFEALPGNDTPINVLWDGVSVFCSNSIPAACIYARNTSLILRNSSLGWLPALYRPMQPGLLKNVTGAPNLVGLDLQASAGGHCLVEDNYFLSCAVGAKISGDWCFIERNHFEGMSSYSFADEDHRGNLRDTNTIESVGGGLLLLHTASSQFHVIQNQFYDCNNAIVGTADDCVKYAAFNNFEQVKTAFARATFITNQGWQAIPSAIDLSGIHLGGAGGTQITSNYVSAQNFIGNGAGLTNLVSSVNPAQISAIIQTNESITSRLIVITNTAKSYQINLQAQLDALPHSTNRMYPGGGTIELGEGIFYAGGALYTNYAGVDSITIKGKGVVQTCLVFTNNSGLTFQGHGNNIGVNMEGLLIASTVDSNYFLVRIQNNNRSTFSDVTFVPWSIVLTAPLGLELGQDGNQLSAGGLSGLWDDDSNGVGGDNFTVENCNFDSLALGLVISADHARINNNFFEACNLGSASSTWPLTDAFSLGGALILGSDPDNQPFMDVAGIGNHFFRNNHAVIDLRTFAPRHEIVLYASAFEYNQGSFLARTNANPELFFDGVSGDISPWAGIETNSLCQYVVRNNIYNPNFRVRVGNHYYGSNLYDTLIATNFIGNGSGLTNLPVAGLTGGWTTNLLFPGINNQTNILHITNGIIMGVTTE